MRARLARFALATYFLFEIRVWRGSLLEEGLPRSFNILIGPIHPSLKANLAPIVPHLKNCLFQHRLAKI